MELIYLKWMPTLSRLYDDIFVSVVAIPSLGLEIWHRFSRWYHKVYIYVSVFSVTYIFLLYQLRQSTYQLPLSYNSICEIYASGFIPALMTALMCSYSCAAFRLIYAQHGAEIPATQSLQEQDRKRQILPKK